MVWFLYRKKTYFHFLNLNKCIITEFLVNGEVWIPKEKYNFVKNDKIEEDEDQEINIIDYNIYSFDDIDE